MTVYTIGHSTRSLDDFVALLQREGVRHLADVRTFPASRRYPHFNREPLALALAEAGIAYSHHPALGGRRTPKRDSRNTAWRNAGFRGYADYMEGEAFASGLDALLATAAASPTAIMCAEAVPWRCHRSLIADALVARGVDVQHILDAGSKPHTLTSFAVARDGRVSYTAPPSEPARQSDLFADDDPERV
ncbi:MAG TPA: DUF488 domain-containing protein [Gemmatimonadaceae bacterium]|jgi:uncharacterized protein (DUF488 family)|nr:DUF488 domain-containing protein [Gemmatimonadaceae bacterium]